MRHAATKFVIMIMMIGVIFSFNLKASGLDKTILPEDTRWVIHLDVQRLNDTTLFKMVMDDKALKELETAKTEIYNAIKMDPFKDVMGITVYGNQEESKNMVVCLNGNFGSASKEILNKINEFRKLEKQKYNKETIYNVKGNGYVVFKGDNHLLFSKEEGAIKKALDVMKGKSKSLDSSELLGYLSHIPQNAFMSAAVTDLSKMRYHGPQAMMLNCTGAATFMSLEADNKLTVRAMLKADSEQNAQNMENIVRGLMALGSMQKDKIPAQYMDMLNAVRVERNNQKLNLEFTYPSEKLVKMIKEHTDNRHSCKHEHKHNKHKHDEEKNQENED